MRPDLFTAQRSVSITVDGDRGKGTARNVAPRLCELRGDVVGQVEENPGHGGEGTASRGQPVHAKGRRSALRGSTDCQAFVSRQLKKWLRGRDLNPRPLGYESRLTSLPGT